MKERKTRHDKGTIKATNRDITILSWIGYQYATRLDIIIDLMRNHPGPGADPEGLSESAVRPVQDDCAALGG